MICPECSEKLSVSKSRYQPDPDVHYVERAYICKTPGCHYSLKVSEMPTDIARDEIIKLYRLLVDPGEITTK